MEKIENREEEKIRSYLNSHVQYYNEARNRIGIPLDKEKLENLIKRIDITIFEDENTNATFEVSQRDEFFKIIKNNFDKNGATRNNFLLLHEMTHLSSNFNKELFETENLIQKCNSYSSVQNNKDMSGIDVAYGLIAIDEVLSQWCCEKCDSAMTGKKKETKNEKHTILGTTLTIKTDFSEKDIYAPLEGYVEDFAVNLGFKNIDEFAKSLIIGEKSLFEMINEQNVERLGYIGILCEGIYQGNGFRNCGLPESDIPKAIKYLDARSNHLTDQDDPSGDEQEL